MTENGNKLWPALLRAQQAIKPVVKDATNPFYKSKYADLATVIDAVKEAANPEGLVISQCVGMDDDGRAFVNTVVTHAETGEHVRDVYPVACADPNDPQKFGAAVTYARRYSLKAMFLVADEDDDGNTASGKGQAQGVAAPPPAQASPRAQGSARPDPRPVPVTKLPYRPPVAHSDDDADMAQALAEALDQKAEADGKPYRIVKDGKFKITGKNAEALKIQAGSYSAAELAAMGKLSKYRERLEYFAQLEKVYPQVKDPGIHPNPGFDPPRTGGVSQFQDKKEADAVVDLTGDDGLPF